jgi:thymidylate kinase
VGATKVAAALLLTRERFYEMIVKFDGINGCGKSTLSRAVAESLRSKGYRVTVVNEFSSPALYDAGSAEPIPVDTMQIREAVLDPAFDYDDVERQLLLHFLSRRKNRVEIPHLDTLHDYVIVDRSTLSNYAYAAALSRKFTALSNLAVGDMETADQIFWIDTPVDLCVERLSTHVSDPVERKGSVYLERVRKLFQRYAVRNGTTRTLDGRSEIAALVKQVLATIEEPSHND